MPMTIESPTRLTFDTLQEAYDWVNEQIKNGLKVQQNRICADRFQRYRPRGKNSRIFQLFGATWGVEKVCKKIEPNGKWRVELTPPGTTFYQAGIFQPREKQTTMVEFSLWYSRFLPYAKAMMLCEDGFETDPICHTSINCWYGTVGGFWELGCGDGYESGPPEYYRIEEQDVDLFQEIYHASMRLKSPSLPFDESFAPCVVYVALHDPKGADDFLCEGHYLRSHVREVCEEIGKPVPKGF